MNSALSGPKAPYQVLPLLLRIFIRDGTEEFVVKCFSDAKLPEHNLLIRKPIFDFATLAESPGIDEGVQLAHLLRLAPSNWAISKTSAE